MNTVIGVSAFGLQDCVALPDARCYELGFYPSSAILPLNPFGRILTGEEAYKERTHVGLEWPPEARVISGKPIRRSPICTVWRALVEAGDRISRWDAGRGVSFSLARILASHIKALVKSSLPKTQLLRHDTGKAAFPISVVAISDHLDEFGQELLLRELIAMECNEAMLVWRPVAAALAWLAKVDGDFPRHMGGYDHIHVVYLGPDAFEFTTLRLRVREHKNRYYVLPLRDRSGNSLPLTGMDWAGMLIEQCYQDIDESAFWQAFIQFPEVWQALAHREWNPTDFPRPWNRDHAWTLWNPTPDLFGGIYEISATSCPSLRRIINKSCDLDSSVDLRCSIGEFLERQVQDMAQVFPGGHLRGMIVCGPLAPRNVPKWLSSNLQLLESRGLKIERDLAEPEAGCLWLSSNWGDPIAAGAVIYGQRRLAGIPSYLDTMPQISILAQERGRFSWVPLLKANEVLGGEEHKDKIERQFQLDAGKRKLHVYLYKGSVDAAPTQTDNPFDPQSLPLTGVTPCRARLIREVVRRHGSIEAVQRHPIYQIGAPETRYAHRFAEALSQMKDPEQLSALEPQSTEIVRTPLRRAVFDFTSAPDHDTVLDIEVRIRPASGLARIEILPEDNSFLQGERVLLNYSNMRFASCLPSRARGWPPIEEIVVDPDDYVLISREFWVSSFESTLPDAREYIRILDSMRNNVLGGSTSKSFAGLRINLRALDQDGQACTDAGNRIIARIAEKLEKDFQQFKAARQTPYVKNTLNRIVSRAAWLNGATPSDIVTHIRNIVTSESIAGTWRVGVEAAGRAFMEVEDFRRLYQSVARRLRGDAAGTSQLTEYAGRSICRILMFRKDGHQGLDGTTAQLFANFALQRLLEEQQRNKFNRLYFQMVQLLLYLLRYRSSDPSCFEPCSPKTISVFEETKKSLGLAKNSFPARSPRAVQIQKIFEGFDKYLHYQGTADMLPILRDLAEGDA